MVSHDMVAHRWAQDDPDARTVRGFNMFYERDERGDNVIFSHGYHFAAAAFTTDAQGLRVVLLTTRGYSISTSKHLYHIRRAIPSRVTVFNVPDVSPRHKRGGSESFHVDNLTEYVKGAANLYAKAKRARLYSAQYLADAEGLLSEAERYAAAFAIPFTRLDVADAKATIDKIAAYQAAAYATARAAREQAERERTEELRKEHAAAFAAWQAGARIRVPSSYALDESGSVYLRRQGDALQTSRGAVVPWEHALKVFRFIKLCRERGEAFKANGRTIRVGHFRVDSITAQGDMITGCHFFSWAQIEALARREGVLDLAPDAAAVQASA